MTDPLNAEAKAHSDIQYLLPTADQQRRGETHGVIPAGATVRITHHYTEGEEKGKIVVDYNGELVTVNQSDLDMKYFIHEEDHYGNPETGDSTYRVIAEAYDLDTAFKIAHAMQMAANENAWIEFHVADADNKRMVRQPKQPSPPAGEYEDDIPF